MNYEVKLVQGGMSSAQEGYLIQQRFLGKDTYQVISAKHEVIEEIYKNLAVKKERMVLVPYGLSLLALLKERGVLLEGVTAFVDYREDCAWVTMFDGDLFNAPRKIQGLDETEIVREVDRTIKHFLQAQGKAPDSQIRILSNHQLGVHEPAIEGLRLAEFDVHFDLPSRVIQAKRNMFLIKFIMSLGCALFLTAVGVGAVVAIHQRVNRDREEMEQLTLELNRHKDKARLLLGQKALSLIQQKPKPDLMRLYDRLSRQTIGGTELANVHVSLQDDGMYHVNATYQLGEHVLVSLDDMKRNVHHQQLALMMDGSRQQISVGEQLHKEDLDE